MNDYRASVSFEFDIRPVETVRLAISAHTWSGAVKKAVKAAQGEESRQKAAVDGGRAREGRAGPHGVDLRRGMTLGADE